MSTMREMRKAQVNRLQWEREALEAKVNRLRTVLEEVQHSIKPLLPDGWSDAQRVWNVISTALTEETI